MSPLQTKAERVRRLSARARAAVLDSLAVLLPVSCASCGALDRSLCRRCATRLAERCEPRRCAIRIDSSGGREVPVFAACAYEGEVSALLAALKERGRADAARPLGVLLRAALRLCVASVADGIETRQPAAALPGGGGALLLVLVPSSPRALRTRGYSHLALLLRFAAPELRSVRGLRVVRAPRDQSRLGVRERARNVHGAYAAATSLAGRRVLIVDDVATSGATLREAVRALEAVGAEPVGCAVIAETIRRAPRASALQGDTRGG